MFPQSAKTSWKLNGHSLDISWKTDIGTTGQASLPESRASQSSEIAPLSINTWKEFKEYAATFEPYKYIFRGQEDAAKWRLRTHFHRTGRSDLLRFLHQDIPELHRSLSNFTAHRFRLEVPDENGSFFALAQHHGYPTPLLDWTYSPFVAAYFAYNDLVKDKRNDDRKVRIFIFDRENWYKCYPQISKLAPARPHFSILDVAAINNPRMVQQQALVSVTNVDDIESYIRNREQEAEQTFLQVIDLPASSCKEVMQELSLMGITAGSLFPGLDGVCKQLKERFFDL
jgi:FRG domain